MTQSSVAVSADGLRWLLLNASPDVRQQLVGAAALHPQRLRGSPVEAVVLTNGDADHIAGLLTLRERTPFAVYATPEIHGLLRDNDIFGVLDPALVPRREIAPNAEFGPLPGLSVSLFPGPARHRSTARAPNPTPARRASRRSGWRSAPADCAPSTSPAVRR